MRTLEQIKKDLESLQNQYNSLCAKYGDCLISLRYWNEQKANLEKDIDKLGEVQKELNAELRTAEIANQNKANAGDGPELCKEDVDQ